MAGTVFREVCLRAIELIASIHPMEHIANNASPRFSDTRGLTENPMIVVFLKRAVFMSESNPMLPGSSS